MQVTLQQSGVPYTCLYTEPFYENFQKRAMRYKRQPDDSIATLFPIPAAKIKNWQSSDAIGSAVAGVDSFGFCSIPVGSIHLATTQCLLAWYSVLYYVRACKEQLCS